MGKKDRFIWVFEACVLCLCYSQATSALTRRMGQTVQVYLVLTAVLAVAAMLFLYLPVKLLAGRFGWAPEHMGVRGKGAGICALLFVVLLAGLCTLGRTLCYADVRAVAEWAAAALLSFLGFSLLLTPLCALIASAAVFVPALFGGGFLAEEGLGCLMCGVLLFFHGLAAAGMRREGKMAGWILLLLAGVLCGLTLSRDFLAFAFPLLFLSCLLCETKSRPLFWARFTCYGCALLCALSAGLLAGSLWMGGNFSDNVLLFVSQAFSRPFLRRANQETAALLWEHWALLPLYLLAIFSLFDNRTVRRADDRLFLLPLTFVSILNLLAAASLYGQCDSLIFLGAMAGCGFGQMCRAQKEIEEETAPLPVEEELPKPDTPAAEEGFLPNPLPVPKRHTPREMSYAFEPDPTQMRYDVEVSPDDDFDL